MTYTLIPVSSVTYAMKSKSILNRMGYYCEIERQEKGSRSGCGYVIRVKDDPAKILPILNAGGIAARSWTSAER